jgi:Raf kinase inhibitor-like YbhB/YbcL family protein
MSLTLTSTDFHHAETIPKEHTCDGANRSPAFQWSGVPEGTRALLLVCDDPDAQRGTFHHLAAYNIPPEWKGLEPGFGAGSHPRGFREAINDFGKPGYGGPCPPHGDRPHRYRFRLSALKAPIEASENARCAEIERLAKPLELAAAELLGYYGRS